MALCDDSVATSASARTFDGAPAFVWRYLRPQGPRIIPMAMCLSATLGLQLVAPHVVSRFIDLVVTKGEAAPLTDLWRLAGLYIAATIGVQAARLAGSYFSASVGWAATNGLRNDLTRHALALDMSFHNARTPGELIERLDGDVSAIASMFSQLVFLVVGNALLMLGILVVLFNQNPWVGGALATFAAAAFVVLGLTRKLAIEPFAAERQARSDLASFVEERLGGLDDIRANAGGAHVMGCLGKLNANLTRKGVRAMQLAALYGAVITNVVFIAGYGLALALGVGLFLRGEASVGAVYLIVQYTAMMRVPLEVVGYQMQEMQRAMAGLGRVRTLQSTPARVADGPGAGWSAAAPAVTFEQVGFAYGDGPPVLAEVAFRLEPGRTLGLLGRTGSGKTTLTRLLSRLYDPTTGVVRLDGLDIRQARLAELHAHVGVVTQDVQLFRASVRDNLTFFDPTVSDARLVEVLEALQLGRWLARQPEGLNTLLAGGEGLSSGEAQLLAFARVFLKDPGLVVLDEASSRLDPATEQVIERALDVLLRGERRRTAIIVAHKLATVRRVDEIMILEKGAIVEHGSRTALAADPGSRFSALLKAGLEEALA